MLERSDLPAVAGVILIACVNIQNEIKKYAYIKHLVVMFLIINSKSDIVYSLLSSLN